MYVKPSKEYRITLRSIDLGAMEVVSTYEELQDYRKVGSPFSIPKAALVLAGLAARGTTVITHPAHIDRGYAGLCEVLASLGGRIGREMPPLDAAVKKIPSKKQIYLAFGAKR